MLNEKKIYSFLCLLIIFTAAFPTYGDALMDAATIQPEYRTIQVSSHDVSGGNNDRLEHIESGEVRTILDVKGAGIIRRIWITIAPPPDKLNRSDIILRMYWDGHDEASVNSPIGPFFGQGWNESYPFVSAPLAAAPREGRSLISYFAMPFSDGARIEVENQSDTEIGAFYFNIDYIEMPELPAKMGRFHAWFNREITEANPLGENEWGTLKQKTGNNLDGRNNYLIADLHGQGQFVGVNYYVDCPTTMWYGEGDEMVFIDGETTPSIIGTGTEDYFNTSWCPTEVYLHPYFGLARIGEKFGWLGRFHNYRFHLADPVYFNKSLKFTIEHGHNNVLTLDLATVAYWYQSEAVGVPAIPDKEGRKLKPAISPADIHKWRDAWRREQENAPRLWGKEPRSN